MTQTVILGLGTGRCGTHSLRHVLNSQHDSDVTHEFGDRPVLPWVYSELHFQQSLDALRSRDSSFIGDVAFYLLPYLPRFIEEFGLENIRLVFIQREREATVKSYLSWSGDRDHWTAGKRPRTPSPWDVCFPNYELAKKEDAIRAYWDEYYDTMTHYVENYGAHSLQIEQLNDAQAVEELLTFCGFPQPIVIANVRHSVQLPSTKATAAAAQPFRKSAHNPISAARSTVPGPFMTFCESPFSSTPSTQSYSGNYRPSQMGV